MKNAYSRTVIRLILLSLICVNTLSCGGGGGEEEEAVNDSTPSEQPTPSEDNTGSGQGTDAPSSPIPATPAPAPAPTPAQPTPALPPQTVVIDEDGDFTLTNVTSAAISTNVQTSFELGGLSDGTSVSLTINNCETQCQAIIMRNGVDVTSSTPQVENGDIIVIKVLTSADYETQVSVDISIGAVSKTFSVTTKKRVFELPVEILGVEGTQITRGFELTQEQVDQADKLFFYANNLSYQNKGSIKINQGEWIQLNHTDIDIFEKELHYGGMQHGGMSSIRFTIPSDDLVVGENTIEFRFDISNGISIGYRIFRFNILSSEGSNILPDDFFEMDDVDSWQAPLGFDSESAINAGRDLWYNANLKSHYLGLDQAGTPRNATWYGNVLGPREDWKATCTDCHTQDGRDLKFFAYSNLSIIERSKFHGLTEEEGKKIAAYIRSLNVPAHGRSWNPPYQPGASLKDKPIEYWAAGAGIDAVLENDADMLQHLFPNGTSQEEIDKHFDIAGTNDTTIMPIQLQMPNWKQWLPLIHPKDAFGDFYAISNSDQAGTFSPGHAEEKLNPFIQYPALRQFLEQNDHDAIVADPSAFYEVMGNFWKSNRKFFTKRYGAGGGWRYSGTTEIPYLRTNSEGQVDPGYGQATRTSLARMMAVKFFEIHQEFKLEGLTARLRPDRKGNPRQWLHASGYNIFEVPPHFTAGAWGATAAYEGQPWITGVFETTSWYELQLILNPGYGRSGGTGPVDFNYVPGFIRKASGFPNSDPEKRRPEPLRYYRAMGNVYQVKGIVANPDPSKRSGFRLLQMGPNKHLGWWAPNYPGSEFTQLLNDYEEGLAAKVMNGLTTMMAEALEHPQNHPSTYGRSNNPSQFKLHPETKTDFNQDYDKEDYADVFYRLLPEYLALGVDPLRINRIIDWCTTAWPLMPWDDIRGLPITTGTAATEGTDYNTNIADFIEDLDSADITNVNKISGAEWLVVGSDGSLSGIAPNGAVGQNRFYIEVTDSDSETTTHIVKINVNGTADETSTIAHGENGGMYLSNVDSNPSLSATTFESLAVNGDTTSTNDQWISDDNGWPHWIQIDLQQDHDLTKVEFWTDGVVSEFQFQYWSGSSWIDIVSETNNSLETYSHEFTPVTANRVRLYATSGDGNELRLKEIKVYIEQEVEIETDIDEDSGADGTTQIELILTNVAFQKPTTVDSGAGPSALESEEWNVLSTGTSYFYLQHRQSGKRLRADSPGSVDLAPMGTTGEAVEWQVVDIDGTWSYIISRSEGRKLEVLSDSLIPRLTDSSKVGGEVEWLIQTISTINTAPQFAANTLRSQDANEEQVYSASLSDMISDADGDTLSFRKVSGPGWLTVSSDGNLGGTPIRDNIGLNNWVIAVEDGNGGYDEASIAVDVVGELWNVALNKPTAIDSRNNSSNSGSKAVDGTISDSSKWVSDNSGWPHWIEIDLEGEYTIEQLKVWFRPNNGVAGDFQFQHWDGSQWVDIISEIDFSSSEYSTYFPPVTTTKVRFYATAAASGASDNRIRMWEIEVYGREPSTAVRSPNIASNKPITVDSSYSSSFSGENAVDGNIVDDTSRWLSGGGNWPHWIEIDLETSYEVNRLKFYTGKNGYSQPPTDFQFQRWDGSAWVDIFVETGNTDPKFSRTFTPVITDRVRLYATDGTDSYFRLYEIEVFGSEVP